jgi:hypothetical protein
VDLRLRQHVPTALQVGDLPGDMAPEGDETGSPRRITPAVSMERSFSCCAEARTSVSPSLRGLVTDLPVSGTNREIVSQPSNIAAMADVAPAEGGRVVLRLEGAGGLAALGKAMPGNG